MRNDAFTERLERAPDAGLALIARAAAALRDDRPLPAEEVSGALLETETPCALSAGAADAALDRIDRLESLDGRGDAAPRRAARDLGELLALPDPVREAAFDSILEGAHWGFAGFGIRRLSLDMPGEGKVDLLRIEPGAGVAMHDHEDEEYTLVLTGAFHDGHELYRPGDINVAMPGFRHEPKALPGEVCFALAVSYGSPAFEGPVGLLQRLTGFGR
ncbi:MAG: cupin domain-containing protein [Caulobacter sp.]